MKHLLTISILFILSTAYYSQNLISFQSKKYNYSFKYPDNFVLKASKDARTEFNAVKDGNFASINMNTIPFEFSSYSFDQVTKKTIEDAIKPQVTCFSISKFTKIKISGHNAIVINCDVTSQGKAFSQTIAFIYWPKTSLTFSFCSYKKDFNVYSNMFQTILNSLTLK
ncbi:MAG: hypothetical protein C0448_14610 [Sphingobacteriaceae bacterium]|nr:hypothetical protein [Sphingobacteriaceae bacterium]